MGICNDIAGKVVLITGGSKGIGKSCVAAFCEQGANVVFCARSVKESLALETALNSINTGSCTFVKADVSSEKDIMTFVQKTGDKFGHIDCLINNAGYLPQRRPIDRTSTDDYFDVLKTNLVSYFTACKYTLPYLRATAGSIINIGSIIGETGQEGSAMYTSTKGGIVSLTKSLAIDEARHFVRINCISPGNIKSEMFEVEKQRSGDAAAYEYRSSLTQWLGNGGTGEDIANACIFLASNDAKFITGTKLIVSGGFELGNGKREPSCDWNSEMYVIRDC